MKPLPLRPLPVSGEPISDYLDRLASANGYRVWELWRILDRGDSSHHQALSDALNGHVLPRFSGPSIPRISIPVELFGLQAGDFTHRYRRWCPRCVVEGKWLRPLWRLKVATVTAWLYALTSNCLTYAIRPSVAKCNRVPKSRHP